MKPRLILAVTLIALAITTTAAIPVLYKILNPPNYDTPHSRLLAYEDHFGEFGGFFTSTEWIGTFLDREPSKVLNVYLTSGNFDPDLRKEAEETFNRIYLHKAKPDQKVVIHEIKYSLSELKGFRKIVDQNPPRDTLGIHAWGISKRDNKITYTTSDREAAPKIMEHIQNLGVPADAVKIKFGRPIELRTEKGLN